MLDTSKRGYERDATKNALLSAAVCCSLMLFHRLLYADYAPALAEKGKDCTVVFLRGSGVRL